MLFCCTYANLLTLKISLNVVLGLNINMKQKSGSDIWEFDSSISLKYSMQSIESTQYQAALAVSGPWKGSNF